ncbi:heme ABC exporter ATP-binding protein CcmA [Cytobacillus spongiae]|jgi:heme exporter protein A|uniref:heme ABC exporter ATP-binding protein CcmA n=1 Tax=Cytobacillus spongiae TaxID=2901381 RepID=UPI001F2B878D|nr:heme ABC exporter ATP-binding protein CcmA [Cytobacillus spongiae]UII55273.1 heme ABC exporter ATP-binding protein CcmA [Cytobacillus spongiae]
MLEFKNLSKIIGEKIILRNLSLTLDKGESLAVIGPNGAGKSTLFKCATGLMKPSSGEIWIDQQIMKKNSTTQRQAIGLLGHESFLYSSLTPLENLMFYGKLYKVPNREKAALNLLKKVGLEYFRDIPIRSFSRGMIQRLAIARVLLQEPNVLLLDEPHTGLDQEAVALFNHIIQEKQGLGTSILLISHDFEQVHKLCNRVAILHKGRIISDNQAERFLDVNELKAYYEKKVISK